MKYLCIQREFFKLNPFTPIHTICLEQVLFSSMQSLCWGDGVMSSFYEVAAGIYRLDVPFGGIWTGVLLVRGDQNILVDSGPDAQSVDTYLVPALHRMGLTLADISWLACTHCHGDHVGGHARIRELADVKIAAFKGSKEHLEDPLRLNRDIRARFPEYSPSPSAGLRGVKPDRLMEAGETLGGFLRLIHTPGHDTDAVCWLDERTSSLITGDSLQMHGTKTQGIGLVMDLKKYLDSLEKLKALPIKNILSGHPYLPLGADAQGVQSVRAYLDECMACIDYYRAFLRFHWHSGEHDLATLARMLIKACGGTVPDYLFLPLYTVSECLKYDGLKEKN